MSLPRHDAQSISKAMAHVFDHLYLHGFCSDTSSKKGTLLKQRLKEHGIDLHLLDVRGGRSHEEARVTFALQAIRAYYNEHRKPLRLIGSSMGGLTSAVYAAQYPEHVDRVILLNPAVNLKETWRTIAGQDDPDGLDKWKATGVMTWKAGANKEEVQIPYAYVEDSLKYAHYPSFQCPSIVFVGSNDPYVPPKNGYVLQLEQENPDLMDVIEVEDDHDLLEAETIDTITERALEFFL